MPELNIIKNVEILVKIFAFCTFRSEGSWVLLCVNRSGFVTYVKLIRPIVYWFCWPYSESKWADCCSLRLGQPNDRVHQRLGGKRQLCSMSGVFGFTWSDWPVGFRTGAYLSLAVWTADKEPRRLISPSADDQSMGCRSWVTDSGVPLTSKSSPTDCLLDWLRLRMAQAEQIAAEHF